MTTAERIDLMRKREGIRVAELARRSGVKDATIRTIMRRNYNDIRPDILSKLADALNTSPEYLQGKTDSDAPRKGFNVNSFTERIIECINSVKLEADADIRFCKRAIAEPKMLTGREIYELGKLFDVDPQWLIGETDKKLPFNQTDIGDLKFFGNSHKAEINSKLEELKTLVYDLCTDSRNLTYVQQLCQDELMTARIDLIMEFLRANSKFIYHNLPGIPSDSKPNI